MLAFLSSTLYKSLPGIALALDEGLASTDETYSLFYGERLPWWVDVTAHGKTGHGSRFIDDTAGESVDRLWLCFNINFIPHAWTNCIFVQWSKSSGFRTEHLRLGKDRGISCTEMVTQIILIVDMPLRPSVKRCLMSWRKMERWH